MRDDGACGEYNPHLSIITIDSELVGKQYMHTLIHEIVHSITCRTGIEQAVRESGVLEIISENVATAIVENFKLTKI